MALHAAAQSEGFGTSLGSSVMTLPQSDGDAEGDVAILRRSLRTLRRGRDLLEMLLADCTQQPVDGSFAYGLVHFLDCHGPFRSRQNADQLAKACKNGGHHNTISIFEPEL
jgi:hypothetical protein